MSLSSRDLNRIIRRVAPIVASPSFTGEEDLSALRYRAGRELLEEFPVEEVERYSYIPILVSELGTFLYPAYIMRTACGDFLLFLSHPEDVIYYTTLPSGLVRALLGLGLSYYPYRTYSTRLSTGMENVEKALRLIVKHVEPVFSTWLETAPLPGLAAGLVGEAADIEPEHLIFPARRIRFTRANPLLEQLKEQTMLTPIWNLIVPELLPETDIIIVSPPALEPLYIIPRTELRRLFPRASLYAVPYPAEYYLPITARRGILTEMLLNNLNSYLPLFYLEAIGGRNLNKLWNILREIYLTYEPSIEKIEALLERAPEEEKSRLLTAIGELLDYYPLVIIPIIYDKYLAKPDLGRTAKTLEDVLNLVKYVQPRQRALIVEGYNPNR